MKSGLLVSLRSSALSLYGFQTGFIGEVFSLGQSCTLGSGFIVNLVRDDLLNLVVGALLIKCSGRLSEGIECLSSGRLASLMLGDYSVGSMLDPMGNIILNSSSVSVDYRWIIESGSHSIISRQSVFEPLLTGILSIDGMIPIGRGQRELIIGDRQVGKTSIGVDVMLNQKSEGVLSVYVPIGQKSASILEVFIALLRRDVSKTLAFVVSEASSSSVCQYLSGYSGCSLAEFFMLVRETPAFLMLDNLTCQAVAYREISLLLRRPPGREAFPGEIFFVHSRLLERSAKLCKSLGGGSITAFPVIETLAGDVSGYIPTNVISITDGQVFLSMELFLSGIRPATDIGLSVSRVGSAAQWFGMRLVSGSTKLELAQFAELQSFAQFAGDLGPETKSRLNRGSILVEMLKQRNGSPLSLVSEVSILSLASQEIFSRIALADVCRLLENYKSLPCWVQLYAPVRLIFEGLLFMMQL